MAASGDGGGIAGGGRPARTEPPESRLFTLSYRAALQDDGVLAYAQHVQAHVRGQVRFDSAAERTASTDYVALACVSDLLQAIELAAKRMNLEVEEAEGRAELGIGEPLFLAGVQGFEEPTRIAGVKVRLYVCVDCEPGEFDTLCGEALRCSPVYQSLHKAFPLEVRFSQEP